MNITQQVEADAINLCRKLEACVTEIVEDINAANGDYNVDDDTAFFELAREWAQYGDGETQMTPELRWEFRRITGLGNPGDDEW